MEYSQAHGLPELVALVGILCRRPYYLNTSRHTRVDASFPLGAPLPPWMPRAPNLRLWLHNKHAMRRRLRQMQCDCVSGLHRQP